MSELNSTNAWPFTEIPAEEGLDINAIFGDSTDTANQGNPFEVQATTAAPAPAPATQEMPAAPAVEAAASMPAVAPPKEAPAPAQPESNAAAGNPIAAAFEQKTAENTKKGLLEKPPVFYHKGVKEDIEDASMTFEELRIRKSEDFTDLEEGKRVSWSVEYCGIRKEIKDPKGTTIISMKETIERSREFLEALKKSKEKDPVFDLLFMGICVKAENFYYACVFACKTQNRAYRRSFPSAIGSDKASDTALRQRKGNVIKRKRRIPFYKTGHFKDVIHS